MNTKTLIIPFRLPSDADDYLCTDGELASFSNLYLVSNGSSQSFDRGEPVIIRSNISLDLPSPPDIRFNLRRASLPGWSVTPFTLPQKLTDLSQSSESEKVKIALKTILRLYQEADERNLFTRPFLVLAAYRLHDGSHIVPSSPVLMIPNSQAPVVFPTENSQTGGSTLSVAAAICALQYRLVQNNLTDHWKTRISHLDIFISSPVELFDSKDSVAPLRHEAFTGFTHSVDEVGNAGEHRVWADSISSGWQPAPLAPDAIRRNVACIDSFHLIAAIPISQAISTPDFKDVSFNCGATPSIYHSYPYRPDYRQLSSVVAGGAVEFSGRTTLFDLTVTPLSQLPLECLTPFCNMEGYRPRFLFHSDPQATAFSFVYEGMGLSLPLVAHSSLYGSCFVSSFSGVESDFATVPAYLPESRRYPGAIWRSSGEDMLLFPDKLFMKLNIGEIYALCRAFRASGLVATTAPTAYLFTSEGVFLLRESDDGSFKDAGLICRYRLGDISSIQTFGTSITFSDLEGNIIKIEGTKASVLSDTVAGKSGGEVALVTQGGEIALTTRPLKLGSPEALKHLLALAVRGRFSAKYMTLSLEGSFDLNEWIPVCAVSGPLISRVWGAAFPFFRISLQATLCPSDTLSALAITTS